MLSFVIPRTDHWIIDDSSTLRRHIESTHLVRLLPKHGLAVHFDVFFLGFDDCFQVMFCEWAKTNDFDSRLPKDAEARRKALKIISEQQKTLDSHLKDMPKNERVIAYSELTFKRAAVEWLIATDQVCSKMLGYYKRLVSRASILSPFKRLSIQRSTT